MTIIGIVEEGSQGSNIALATVPPLTDEIVKEFNRDRASYPEEQVSQQNGCLIIARKYMGTWQNSSSGDTPAVCLSELLTRAEQVVNARKSAELDAGKKKMDQLAKIFGVPIMLFNELPKEAKLPEKSAN